MLGIAQISVNASPALIEHLKPLLLPDSPNFNHARSAGFSLALIAEQDNLSLVSTELGEKIRLEIDFFAGKLRHRRHFGGGRNQDLCRAIGLHRNTSLKVGDATAGLGRDAFIMALHGARLSAYEKNPILERMLAWSLQLACQEALACSDVELLEVLNRMSFHYADSSLRMSDLSFDVVYLDPMFPAREKSAKVKKEMQILHLLLAEDSYDEANLFASCWSAAQSRLVIKRPLKAPFFSGKPPNHQIVGKAIRFDVYVRKALP